MTDMEDKTLAGISVLDIGRADMMFDADDDGKDISIDYIVRYQGYAHPGQAYQG